MATTKKKIEEESKQPVRHYKGQAELDHDLYKLNMAKFRKNASMDIHNPYFIGVEHVHFYHSHDSSGKQMSMSNSVAGHKHKIETYVDEDGLLKAKCGPPIKEVLRKNRNGSFSRTEMRIEGDDHVHEISYLRSEKVKVRKINDEAAKHISAYMAPFNK